MCELKINYNKDSCSIHGDFSQKDIVDAFQSIVCEALTSYTWLMPDKNLLKIIAMENLYNPRTEKLLGVSVRTDNMLGGVTIARSYRNYEEYHAAQHRHK